ncbi:Alpha/beta knot methyltransferase [Aspergillus pseudodeflectus]|uniref:rRNA methyltransferase 1, mitochondrial n=1 Tax=Aspergillus pseudodeflectus TaxID=176178 RepID=A0ABR4LBB4_9EURO
MSFQTSLLTLKSSLRLPLSSSTGRSFIRYASLNSAIGRGIRRSQRLDSPRTSTNDSRDRPRFGTKSYALSDSESGRSPRRHRDVRDSRSGLDNNRNQPAAERTQPVSLRSRVDRRTRRPQRTGDTETPWNDSGDHLKTERRPFTPREPTTGKGYRSRAPEVEFDEDEFIRTGNFRALPREHQRFTSITRSLNSRDDLATDKGRYSPRRSSPTYDSASDSQRQGRPGRAEAAALHKSTDQKPERVREHVKIPDTIPYTTPASEFIYGTAAVEAALRCNRRQLYKLYMYQTADEELSPAKVTLRKLALSKNVKVKMAFAEWDRILDKMSAGRPHNGCVLEASPLPRTPIQALKAVNSEDDTFQLELAPQTREEALVNGTNDRITINHSFVQQQRRHPVILMLDGIVDPGNLGAIIRSAYYLGVDAVVFAGRNSAPLSPVTIKSSAGAAENMTLLDVKNEVDFIQRSKANGWRFYAADAPNAGSSFIDQASNDHNELIGHSPCVIMMGNEGSGLSNHIRSQADSIVSIPGSRLIPGVGVTSDPARVDSLNVSVASALLMEKFLRLPLGVSAVPRKERSHR